MKKPSKDSLAHKAYTKTMQSKGTGKMLLYFQNLVKDEEFKKRVIVIRKFEDDAPRPFALASNPELKSEYDSMIKEVCDDYKLPVKPWAEVIDNIIQTDSWVFDYENFGFDVCEITVDTEDKIYPIKIGISPYASREDMIDFVKTNFKDFLSPLQEHFKEDDINIGKFKVRRKEEMYDFIFDNRELTAKEIMRLVGKKFNEVYGYEHIQKIIEREKKRRKAK